VASRLVASQIVLSSIELDDLLVSVLPWLGIMSRCLYAAHLIGVAIKILDSQVASTGMVIIPSFLEILTCLKVICRNRRTAMKTLQKHMSV
jgi:hypothetical protein